MFNKPWVTGGISFNQFYLHAGIAGISHADKGTGGDIMSPHTMFQSVGINTFCVATRKGETSSSTTTPATATTTKAMMLILADRNLKTARVKGMFGNVWYSVVLSVWT